MMPTVVDDEIKSLYADCYKSDSVTEWRRLGALGKAQNITTLCKGIPHETVLEIGAGDGAILSRLSQVGFAKKYYATEISKSGVDKINNSNIPGLAECKIFDGYAVPFADNQFDLVIISHVLEHVEHPRQLIYEAMRLSRVVFIEVPLEDHLRMPNDFILDKDTGHINFYNARTIKYLLQSCRLKIIGSAIVNAPKEVYKYKSGRRGVFNYYFRQLVLSLCPGVSQMFLGFNCALLATRLGQPEPAHVCRGSKNE